jgi:small-conductance mechanosensitive channel
MPPIDRAMVQFDAKPLFAVRGVSVLPAAERVRLIHERLLEAAEDTSLDPAEIAIVPVQGGFRIGTPDRPIVNITTADGQVEEVDTALLAEIVRARLEQAIVDYRAARTPEGVRRAIWRAASWTIGYAVAIAALVALARTSERVTERFVEARIAVWEARARNVVRLRAIWNFVRQALHVGFILLGIFATYVWLNAVLIALPWTRERGFAALSAISEPVRRLGSGLVATVPDLIALALIAASVVAILRILERFFGMVAHGSIRMRRFDPDWAAPTERLLRLLILAFAAIVAYPYIPGSSSEAFKAIGIFAGLMLSLGATSIVANLVAGQMLIYRRAFRVGDRIAVGEVVGDVEEMTAQATYVRTPKNERVTIPNAMVMSSQVVNYSHFARGPGLILHTTVGIGYEVPWQQVQAMLLEAARRTPGLLTDPPPFVLQTKLGDYSPVYEINVYTRDEKAMPATYAALHAAIQDVFGEKGIQIMTPSYVADPADPKVPPRAPAA